MSRPRARSLRVVRAALVPAFAFIGPAASLVLVPRVVVAQGSVTVSGPTDEPLHDITPMFVVRTSAFGSAQPTTIRLQVSRTPAFDQIIVDTSTAGASAQITLSRPLPEAIVVFWRALAYTSATDSVASATSGPHSVGLWLTLISPNNPSGITLQTRRPTFIWSSAQVASPPGPWRYDIEIATAIGGRVATNALGITDTTFTPAVDLEANTSYRWSVTARLTTGDIVHRASVATFILLDPGTPLATLLLQNFPNPFPSATSTFTCIWFDLSVPSPVRLDVLDLRGNLVRTLVPSSTMPSSLAAGRYGRGSGAATGEGSGCDTRFSWDGTAHDGRHVPPGIYLLRLSTNAGVFTRKMVVQAR